MFSRFSLLSTLAIAFAVASAKPTHADNWARFRGPNGTGIADDEDIPVEFSTTKNVRWKTKVEGMGHSSPIVWGERVFMQTAALDGSDRSLLCFDAKTGKEIWKRSIPAQKVKVRYDSSAASATPVTDGEAVFIPFWDGKNVILTAYNFKGDKLWERNLGEFVSQHGVGASPILYRDTVIYSIDKDAFRDTVKRTGPVANPSTLYAFDKKTGKSVWETPREAVRACYSVPFLWEKPGLPPELIVTSTSAITSYDPRTGKSNWYWTWKFPKDELRTIAATTFTDNLIFACSGDGSGDRLMVGVELKGKGSAIHPEQIWANAKKSEAPYVPCPLIKDGHIYFVNDKGFAGCVVAKTGKTIWYERLGEAKAFYASPLLIAGKIYAASEAGDVYVFAAETKFKQPAPNALSETIRATPAVANGALYIRTQDHLYCVGAK